MTIIVLLILAGVSINAIVGENGVISNAEKAKEQAKEAETREELEYMMFNYTASDYADEDDGLSRFLIKAMENGTIDSFLASTDGENAIVEKDGKYYELIRKNENVNEYEAFYTELSEGMKAILDDAKESGAESAIILTQKTIEARTGEGFEFVNGQTYVIKDSLSGNDFDFNIPCGDPVTIKIAENMVINNSDTPNRSAINLASGVDSNGKNATLNLYIYKEVTVDSSFGYAGSDSPEDATERAEGGTGAYAGIHVPKEATLNLYGTGTLKATGGNAGHGGGTANGNKGGGGRRPELELE